MRIARTHKLQCTEGDRIAPTMAGDHFVKNWITARLKLPGVSS